MRYRRRHDRYQQYEKPLPGHQLQIGVKFLEPLPGQRRYYQHTAIDDCTRIRILKIYERNTQQTAITFVDYVLSKPPFTVQCIQTDNGSEFGSQFHWHVLDKDIKHRYIRPRPSSPRSKSSIGGCRSGSSSTTTTGPPAAWTARPFTSACEIAWDSNVTD